MFARSCSESPSAFGRRSWGNPRRQKKIPSGTLYSGSGSQQFVICGGNWGTREPDALSTASALPAGMEDVSARHDIHLAGQHVLMEAVGQDNGPPVGCSDYSPRIIAGAEPLLPLPGSLSCCRLHSSAHSHSHLVSGQANRTAFLCCPGHT